MGASNRERLVLLHAWPDGDFFENTRGSQRVKMKKWDVMKNNSDDKCLENIGLYTWQTNISRFSQVLALNATNIEEIMQQFVKSKRNKHFNTLFLLSLDFDATEFNSQQLSQFATQYELVTTVRKPFPTALNDS